MRPFITALAGALIATLASPPSAGAQDELPLDADPAEILLSIRCFSFGIEPPEVAGGVELQSGGIRAVLELRSGEVVPRVLDKNFEARRKGLPIPRPPQELTVPPWAQTPELLKVETHIVNRSAGPETWNPQWRVGPEKADTRDRLAELLAGHSERLAEPRLPIRFYVHKGVPLHLVLATARDMRVALPECSIESPCFPAREEDARRGAVEQALETLKGEKSEDLLLLVDRRADWRKVAQLLLILQEHELGPIAFAVEHEGRLFKLRPPRAVLVEPSN